MVDEVDADDSGTDLLSDRWWTEKLMSFTEGATGSLRSFGQLLFRSGGHREPRASYR